jgi:peptidoglycan/xylan/chitin deacetylase (PgdA/CDA1 family)
VASVAAVGESAQEASRKGTAASPDARRVTVCLTFDFDAMSLWIGFPHKSNNPASISRGEFGAVAVPRILDLLTRHELPATFFVPGHTALAYPELVAAIVEAGHEIGHHGWVHENPADFDRDGERRNLERGFQALEKTANVKPVGYRSPGGALSPNTTELLLEFRLEYDSSCSGSDFYPYYLRQGDRWSQTEPFVFGRPVPLVEVPWAWHLEDFASVEFQPPYGTNIYPPSVLREIWQGDFDYAYDHCPDAIYDLVLHPQAIGRGHRLTMLEAFVTYMREKPGVHFARMRDVVSEWRQANPLAEVSGPEP